MATIQINGHDVSAESQMEGGSHFSPDASKSDYIIIHCTDFLKEDQYEDFKRLQVEVLNYIAQNTYLCRYQPHDLERVRQLPYVVYANVYHQDFVVEAGLKKRTTLPAVAASTGSQPDSAQGSSSQTEAQSQPISEITPKQEDGATGVTAAEPVQQSQLHDATVSVHPGAIHEDVKQKIANTLSIDPGEIYKDGDHFRVDLKSEDFKVVAAIDEVRAIDEFPEIEFYNHIARKNLGLTDPVQATADLRVSSTDAYEGQGEIIVVTDTGFDRGATDVTIMHPAFDSKIHSLYSVWRQSAVPLVDPAEIALQFNDPSGHGTHVCGSIVGSGDSSFGPIAGTAPLARLVVQSCTRGAGGGVYPKDNSVDAVLTRAYDDVNIQARISTNSWGAAWAGQQPAYGVLGEAVDALTKLRPDYFVLFAAGNFGKQSAGGQIGTSGASKNVLTVGSCESTQEIGATTERTHVVNLPTSNSDYQYVAGQPQGKLTNVAAFSSRGPTSEGGRTKPDVVAPGVAIYSTLSQNYKLAPLMLFRKDAPPDVPVDANGRVQQVDDFNKGGITPDPGPAAPALGGYVFVNGTSHSTPLVAGCAAVLRQVYIGAKGNSPTSAMLKALIVNGAVDISGPNHDRGPKVIQPAPDNSQGFGRVSLPASVKTITFGSCIQNPPIIQNEFQDYPVTWAMPPDDPSSTSTPKRKLPVILTATLVWTDPPGVALVNQLSLKVTSTRNNEFRYGNTNNQNMDTANNVQRVVWSGIKGDGAVIRVKAERVTTTVAYGSNQDFALVWNTDWGAPVKDGRFYSFWNQYLPSPSAYRRWRARNTAVMP